MNSITSLKLENSKDSKLSCVKFNDDEYLKEHYKELTNTTNGTACSGYGSIEDRSSKSMLNELNGLYDILDTEGEGVCSLNTSVRCLSDNSVSYNTQTNEPAEDDYKSPENIKQYFTHRKYKTKMFASNESNYVKENVQSLTDIIEKNNIETSSEEPIPSTIFSNHSSLRDIKYIEDITDIEFCESGESNVLNRAFVEK